ncbi:hypothetical protein ACFFJB_12800 [Camelimonas abortus]|uniref:Uncharacterized protein n=1 Tax=Camelimonas abortus TaxID=1017184 RepID=A0ABV7LCR6_9HYPH
MKEAAIDHQFLRLTQGAARSAGSGPLSLDCCGGMWAKVNLRPCPDRAPPSPHIAFNMSQPVGVFAPSSAAVNNRRRSPAQIVNEPLIIRRSGIVNHDGVTSRLGAGVGDDMWTPLDVGLSTSKQENQIQDSEFSLFLRIGCAH